MPQRTFVDEKLPITKDELEKQSVKDRAGIPQNIQGARKKKVIRTSHGRTASLKVDTSTPPIVAESRGDVQDQLDLENKGNIPARARALDENVNAWVSPDETAGAGWANPAAVDKDSMVYDGKDTVQKAWDKLTGGGGTANGEKLNDNMKRKTAASIQINSDSKWRERGLCPFLRIAARVVIAPG